MFGLHRRYLFTAWRAGVWGRGAGDIQGAGATAGGGGASDPNTDVDSSSQTRFNLRLVKWHVALSTIQFHPS